MAYGEIRIQSDGSPWRPLIHCRDIARAFVAFGQGPQGGRPQPGHQRRRQHRELPGPRRRRPGPAADPLGQGRLHRRGRRRPAQLPGQLRPALPAPARLPAPVQPGQRHGGAPPQDGRARLRQEGLRGRPVRPPPHAQGPIQPPQLIREEHHDLHRDAPAGRLPDRPGEAGRRPRLLRAGLLRAGVRRARAGRPGSSRPTTRSSAQQGDAAGHALPARPQGRDQAGPLHPRGALRRDPRPARRARRPSARASAPSCRPRTAG